MTSEDRILRDELQELVYLKRVLTKLKATTLPRIQNIGRQWKDFTPTLSATVTNPVLGTGGVIQGRYLKIGTQIVYRFYFQFGTSGVNGGNGLYRISVPVDMSSQAPATSVVAIGDALAFDWSVAGSRELIMLSRFSTTMLQLNAQDAQVAHNNPWIWTVDDRCGGTVVYEGVD